MSDLPQSLPNPNPSGHELPPEQSVPLDPASLAQHYERDDVSARGILRFTIALLIGIVIAIFAMWLVLSNWTNRSLRAEMQLSPADVEAPVAPGPGLDAVPEVRLQETQMRDAERLTTYGWLDQAAGVVHIPIEDAMRLLVERGLPAQAGEAPTFALEPAFRLDSSGGVVPAGSDEVPGGAGDGTNNGGETNGDTATDDGADGSAEDSGGEGEVEGETETGESSETGDENAPQGEENTSGAEQSSEGSE